MTGKIYGLRQKIHGHLPKMYRFISEFKIVMTHLLLMSFMTVFFQTLRTVYFQSLRAVYFQEACINMDVSAENSPLPIIFRFEDSCEAFGLSLTDFKVRF